MTSMTRTAFYNVASISAKYDESNGTRWLDLTLMDEGGGQHIVTAFVKGPIAIDGADFINFVASEPTPA